MPIEVLNVEVYRSESKLGDDPEPVETVDAAAEIYKPLWWGYWKNLVIRQMNFSRQVTDCLFDAVEQWKYVDPQLPIDEFNQIVGHQRESVLPIIHKLLEKMTGISVAQMPPQARHDAEMAAISILQHLRKILDGYAVASVYTTDFGPIKVDKYALRVSEMPHLKPEKRPLAVVWGLRDST